MEKKEKVIVIIGPTAVGKTRLSVDIAKRLNGEIINGDSTQVYRSLNIGTAKITEEEMEGIPHHLIDIKEADESFTVADFQKVVRPLITDITNRGKVPIIAGGTGLYIQSVLYDYEFSEAASDDEFRERLETEAMVRGNEVIHDRLKEIDPVSAKSIHPNNLRRVIRALEVYHVTGTRFSEYLEKQENKLLYDVTIIGLTMDRDKLYERINHRTELMMQQGLLEEVEGLYKCGIRDSQAVRAIGYKELYDYFDGYLTLEESVDLIKQSTRRYAKRQLTWFRNKLDVAWFDMTDGDYEKKLTEILRYVEGK
ncbi:tRNA (adenosine(37)-N6)-dimethylallyltransferase MiaA [Priestia taiwanensis]|uniref:tRNA dimethylallyltransferase n=1 Tax=Priestia taiwanensis TaxID=1347902 RepID=A0A917APH5_9BACI|nr:tRNA (adenosine(37)-N6)-dimethylallyltransferase MiaA [Priestia taiwanensis]MBM7362570.1 tRNA dimethylallyltransferase [Priestia taiwanensis]GGE63309.1 tRNA dimethylallyltransferase [Priestia taiwanensis]